MPSLGLGLGTQYPKRVLSRFSAEASDYFTRLGALRVGTYDAANAALIDRLVGNGGNFWPASGAFNAMAGYLYPGNGANLIPLKDGHDAGTLNNFVTGDWNAVTGLKADGSTKYVDSNRNNNSDGQNDKAMGLYHQDVATTNAAPRYMGAGNTDSGSSQVGIAISTGAQFSRSNSGTANLVAGKGTATGYMGISRSASANYINRVDGSNIVFTTTSQTPLNRNIYVFGTNFGPALGLPADIRSPFYHIGPNLNGAGELAELDAALTEWKNALASA